MWEFLFLLLPLAALSGWLIGRRASMRQAIRRLAGLNKLLDHSSNKKAVDVLVQLMDSNQEAVETHLALGGLFRRQGEVDKAIGIHERLIAKPSLTEEQRALSLLELSRDYMRAGVLDRAESVLLELIELGYELDAGFQGLLDVYQQSKDWLRAIQTAQQWQTKKNRNMSYHIAHFYCELAEQQWLKGERVDAYQHLKEALVTNKRCVRASLLLGNIEAQAGRYRVAIRAYKQIQKQDEAFLSEIVLPLARCYESLHNAEGMIKYFDENLQKHLTTSAVLAFAEWLNKSKGESEAMRFVVQHLRKNPSLRGLSRLVQFSLARAEGSLQQDLLLFQEL
ncbi:MAG TPA: lipopolysaccharide assembly protein LapB, partial [Gammaproteobacteria bacterium]|nr:lipopolysaccharide assembly protein LapB [Gammaproteobacteria bacterium]